MTEFVEVKTAELVGKALDWAVAQVDKPEGFVLRDATGECGCWVIGIAYDANDDESWMKSSYSPSTDWAVGGPLITKHRIDLTFDRDGLVFAYLCDEDGLELPSSNKWEAFGETHLIAACRAIVASVLGDTVSIPRELLP